WQERLRTQRSEDPRAVRGQEGDRDRNSVREDKNPTGRLDCRRGQLAGTGAPTLEIVGRFGAISFQAELFHSIDQRLAAQVEVLGRVRLVPVEFLKRPNDQVLLDRLQADTVGRKVQMKFFHGRPFPPQEIREVVQRDFVTAGQHDDSLDDVLELPHVARPGVYAEVRQHPCWQHQVRSPLLFLRLEKEVLDQFRNILGALPERRKLQWNYRQTVIQVLAEGLVFDHCLQIAVR